MSFAKKEPKHERKEFEESETDIIFRFSELFNLILKA